MGGPDIVPWRKAQMNNSYPFFNRYSGKLDLVAMAVQEPTLTYTNPKTEKKFTREEFVAFARDYLGVDIIFWSVSAPWLSELAHAAQIAGRLGAVRRSAAPRRRGGARHDARRDDGGHGPPGVAQPVLRERDQLRIAARERGIERLLLDAPDP